MFSRYYYLIGLLLLTSCGGAGISMSDELDAAYASLPEEISYNFHVRPILSENCFQCHGPDANTQKANLRIDLAEFAYKELSESPGKYAIVPKKPRKSELVQRIISENPDYVMPTPESHMKLSDEQKATLIKWIEQGATYEKHWAYLPVKEPEVPEINHENWVQNEIDHFTLDKQKVNGLEPAAPAKKELLIRRLSLAIRGFAPSIEEVEAFVGDQSSDASEKWIDKFLASPDYGERMAIHWLELARYADSDGYLDDKMRDLTPWREWVIRAFNDNMSYEDFVSWQLAGDLLPDASKESLLATAFNRLHRRNSEAGIVYEEFRTEYVADRTNTFGKAFLATSFECAKCHDHKFDPVSQKDYFQIFHFFNSTDEIGSAVYGPDITPGPSLLLTDSQTDDILDYLNNKLDAKRKELSRVEVVANVPKASKVESDIKRELKENKVLHFSFDSGYEQNEGSFKIASQIKHRENYHLRTNGMKLVDGPKGKALFIDDDYSGARLNNRDFHYERTLPYSFDFYIKPDTIYDEALVFMNSASIRYGMTGYTCLLDSNRLRFIISHAWPYNSIELVSKEPLTPKEWSRISITYDGTSQAEGIHLYKDGKVLATEVRLDNLYKSSVFIKNVHTLGSPVFMFGKEQFFKLFKNGAIDEFSLYKKELTPIEVAYLHNDELLDNKPKAVQQFYTSLSPQFQSLKKEYKVISDSLNGILSAAREIMVMGDRAEPRKTYVLERGNYDTPGEEVGYGTPESILAFSEKYPPNRLGLAQWLFDKENPLTARVFVNRIWQMHFGRGLVKTSEDFGNQGSLPSHPELLDWLANWFMESGWDIKALHKKILSSATYQQSSKIREDLLEKDPENVFLARGPRFRMPAEILRDNALQTSGLLVKRIGGESAYPYQPEGLWDEVSNKIWRYKYLQQPGEGNYRKSIYTVWKRTTPPPSLMIFDAADRGNCVVRRQTTSTPLQSLVLLNDPQYMEASRVLAEASMQKHGDDPMAQCKDLYYKLLGTQANEKELNKTQKLYEQLLTTYQADPEAAQELIQVGYEPVDTKLDTNKLAALTVVANSLMNTTEAYMIR